MKHTHNNHITKTVGTALAVGMVSFIGTATVSAADGYPPRYQVLSGPPTAKNVPVRKKRLFKPIAPVRMNAQISTTQPEVNNSAVYPSYSSIDPPIPVDPPTNYYTGPRIPEPPIPSVTVNSEPVIEEEPELAYTSENIEPKPKPVAAPKPKPAPTKSKSSTASSSYKKPSSSRSGWSRWGSRSRSGSS